MTKEDFRMGILEAIEDMKNPNNDFAKAEIEGAAIVAEIHEHDPVLAQKFQCLVDSMVNISTYIKSRGEPR